MPIQSFKRKKNHKNIYSIGKIKKLKKKNLRKIYQVSQPKIIIKYYKKSYIIVLFAKWDLIEK